MIVGHGAIASALQEADKDDLLFFAAGVANSLETREKEYRREEKLLTSQDFDKHLVYFSSLCVFTSTDRYAAHKLRMESLVRWIFPHRTIMRLGNIEWAVNPHQLVPFLKRWDGAATLDTRDRYLLSREEFLHWVRLIPSWNCEMNVPGERLKPIDIARRLHESDLT